MYQIRDKKTGNILDLKQPKGYRTVGHVKLAFNSYIKSWRSDYKRCEFDSYSFDDNTDRFEIVQRVLDKSTEEELLKESILIIENFTKDYHKNPIAEKHLEKVREFLGIIKEGEKS